jgi:hypothetical protein
MVSRWYFNLAVGGGTGLTVLLGFFLGLRGLRLLIGVVVLWFPIVLLCTFLLNRIIPPPLEGYKPRDEPPRGSGPGLSLR